MCFPPKKFFRLDKVLGAIYNILVPYYGIAFHNRKSTRLTPPASGLAGAAADGRRDGPAALVQGKRRAAGVTQKTAGPPKGAEPGPRREMMEEKHAEHKNDSN